MTEQKKFDREGAGAAETSYIAEDPDPARRRSQTAARKQEAVVRVLRGEDIELVARSIDATAAAVSVWREVFLETGASGLKHRAGDVRDEESNRLRARVGEIAMDNERLYEKILEDGGGPPFRAPEVEAMSAVISISTGQAQGVSRVCRVWGLSRASVYPACTGTLQLAQTEAQPELPPVSAGPPVDMAKNWIAAAGPDGRKPHVDYW